VVQETVDANGFVWSRTQMSDWQKVGDVWVAYKAIETGFGKGDDGKPMESASKRVFTVKSCEIGSKENLPAIYEMAWPDGTIVKGKDGKMYEAKGGELQPIEAGAIESKGNATTFPDGTMVVLKDGKKYRARDGQLVPIEGK
jgi:hypothetical protein